MTFELEAEVPERGVDLALRVAPGETVALLGPNGAGKSTALAVAAGLLRPARGRVALDGRTLTVTGGGGQQAAYVPPHARRIALLAQDPLLFPHLDVRANVEFAPRAQGAGRAAAREAAERWLTTVGVADLAHRRPGELSGGQAQRVALARALAADPLLLMLDEPMAALDVAVTPAVRQVLRTVLAERSALLVTHDVLDALLLADRVVVLEDGRVVEEGPTSEVLSRPRSAFAARIAGLNILTGTWREGRVHCEDGSVVAGMSSDPAPTDGDRAVAVFSPGAVSVYRDAPGGSPRTVLRAQVTEIEPHGDRIRIRTTRAAADVTPQAAAELDLAPGAEVLLSIKATEITVYPA